MIRIFTPSTAKTTQYVGQIDFPPLLCRCACNILVLYILSSRPISPISCTDNMDRSHGARRSEENPACPLLDSHPMQHIKQILPLKRGKNGASPCTATRPPVAKSQISHEDGSSNKSREPKDHSDGLNCQNGEFVCGCGIEARGESEIGYNKECSPYAAEDEEVDL